MRHAMVLVLLGALVVAAGATIGQATDRDEAGQDAAIDRLNCTVYSEDCSTPTPEPTATETPTPEPTATNTPVPALSGWHAPTDHEHGDAPPQWATDWSVANLGTPIVYGGDEASSPMEVGMKEHVFKGFLFHLGSSGRNVDLYLRYHAGSNPADRAAQFHSYELYVRDTVGNVSFFQGLYDTGNANPNSGRCPRRTTPLACEQQRPIMLVVDQTAWNQGIRSEQWYMFGLGNWSPEFSMTIVGTTTLYNANENATAMDQSTWVVAPDHGLGLQRRGEVFLFQSSLTGWFCTDKTTGAVLATGSATCAVGIPEYRAPTLAADMRTEFGVSRISVLSQRTFPTGGQILALPN